MPSDPRNENGSTPIAAPKIEEEEEDLKVSWALLRGPLPEPVEEKIGRQHPGDLVIATSRENILVRIHPDGQITYGPDYKPDDAAEILWTAIALKRVAMNERLMHFDIMEQIVRQMGEADLHYERMQQLAHAEGATEHDKFMEEMARRNLEARVHQMIEFARGVAEARRAHNPTLLEPR
jgi:hypothetical protein